jgi:hypothetical protein
MMEIVPSFSSTAKRTSAMLAHPSRRIALPAPIDMSNIEAPFRRLRVEQLEQRLVAGARIDSAPPADRADGEGNRAACSWTAGLCRQQLRSGRDWPIHPA